MLSSAMSSFDALFGIFRWGKLYCLKSWLARVFGCCSRVSKLEPLAEFKFKIRLARLLTKLEAFGGGGKLIVVVEVFVELF